MKKEKKRLLPGAALAALAAAALIYLIMLNIEKNMMGAYEKGTVYTAKQDMGHGVELDENSIETKLAAVEMPVELIPAAAIRTKEALEGHMTAVRIDKGSVVTEAMLEDVNQLLIEMKEPVTAALRAEDLYQMVNGILRSGDRIHIYTVEEDTKNANLIWENVFVQGAFDNSGNQILDGDEETAAARINIILEKSCIERFYSELAKGSLRVVKAEGGR